jgi:sigma-54-dependent transcriptional regulator
MGQSGIYSPGRSAAFLVALGLADALAPSSEPLLLEGEPGSGKNYLARYIHQRSRRPGAFVEQPLPALSDTLQKDTLFGHVRGAFTDAFCDTRGLLHEAHDGTLFLDELADATLATQALFLRVMECGTFRRQGEAKDTHVRVRIVAATNASLEARIKEGSFRQDLRDRIGPFCLRIPPLRERRDEILPRFRLFLAEAWRSLGKDERPMPELGRDTVALLEAISWPGNLRQLRQEAQFALLMLGDGDTVLPRHLSPAVEAEGEAVLTGCPLAVAQRRVRRRREARALRADGAHSTIAAVAQRLQVSRRRAFQLLAQPPLAGDGTEREPRRQGG